MRKVRKVNLYGQITIEKNTYTENASGTDTPSWSVLKTTFAEIYYGSGSVKYEEAGPLPYTSVQFQVRWDSRIDYKCRIIFNNEIHNIDQIEIIGRNKFMKIITHVYHDTEA